MYCIVKSQEAVLDDSSVDEKLLHLYIAIVLVHPESKNNRQEVDLLLPRRAILDHLERIHSFNIIQAKIPEFEISV